MTTTNFTIMAKKLKKKHDIDLIYDVLLSQDNLIILLAHVKNSCEVSFELAYGSMAQIGLKELRTFSLIDLLSYFDENNAYSEVSGKKEHYDDVYTQTHDFVARPTVTFPIRNKSGRYWIRFSAFPIAKASNLFSVFITDVTSNLIEEENIFRKTHLDSLTGVFNKYALDFHYGCRYHFDDFHVLFLDLDNFKELNDAQGHAYGNLHLKQFATILKQYESEYNRFYRIGGDEFVGLFFLPSLDVKKIADNIIKETQKLAIKAKYPNVSVSIGIVKAEGREDVIRKADQLLYKVKAAGKGHYLFKTESDM